MMETDLMSRPAGIESFDRRRFDEACAELMRLVLREGWPDILIGIKTGGLYVADAMAAAMSSPMPVLAVTCRRPSTRYKARIGLLKTLIGTLPRPIVDRLRLIEHAMLTPRSRPTPAEAFQFDPAELQNLDAWLAQAGSRARIVIVDDAVDSGATLSCVLKLVTDRAPEDAEIRSAVITVTTPDPLAVPDYSLYRQQLCRFPWSLDG